MLKSPQFLQILAAEADHCVDVKIALSADAKADFERRLIDAFSSDGYNDTTRSWNEERAKVVREAIDDHLIPLGVKFARDWLREETEDHVAWSCSDILREVR
jgi:transcription elongation factor SPT6